MLGRIIGTTPSPALRAPSPPMGARELTVIHHVAKKVAAEDSASHFQCGSSGILATRLANFVNV